MHMHDRAVVENVGGRGLLARGENLVSFPCTSLASEPLIPTIEAPTTSMIEPG